MTSLYLSGTQINFGSYQPVLTFTQPLSVSGNTVSINLTSYSTTGSDTNYLKINGTNSMATNANITLSGTGTFTGIHSGNGAGITNIDYNNISTNKPNITSITINTETRPYPPVYFTDPATIYTAPNASNTVNNTLYGRGTYVATPGSVYSSGTAPNITYQHLYYIYGGAPSLNPSSTQWTSGFGIFNNTGYYSGSINTDIGGTSINGETATLKFPYSVVITSYDLTASENPYHNYMMKDWVLCGSTNGINYTQLHSTTNIVFNSLETRKFSFPNSVEYLYYRIVIRRTNNTAINSGTYSATVCRGILFYGYEIKNGQSAGALGIGTTATGTSATDNASLLVYGTTKLVGNTNINNGGVLYINGSPSSNPGSNGYTCLWNQAGVGPTLSGYQISLTTGITPTVEAIRIDSIGNVGIKNSFPNLTLDVGSTNDNHSIGRGLLNGSIHDANKRDSLSIGRVDGASPNHQFLGIKYNVSIGANDNYTGADNQAYMSFFTWGNNVWNSKEVIRISSRGRLGLGTTAPAELLDVNGNIKCVGEIKNQYWRFSNDPDYCRLYNIGVNTYFNFAAAVLYADASLNVNGGIIYINAANQGVSGSRGIFFRSGYADYNCSILTYDHSGDGFPDGLSINSYDGISFCTGANSRSERMRINQSGNVGIGSANPQTKLEVNGTTPTMSIKASSEGDSAILYLATPYTPSSAYKCAIIAQGISNWSRSKLHFCLDNTSDNTYPTYNATVSNARMTITADGNVGINVTSPSFPLVVTGTPVNYTVNSAIIYLLAGTSGTASPQTIPVTAYINGNLITPAGIYVFSDERIKKQIQDLENEFALTTIMKLNLVSFKYVDCVKNYNSTHFGFVAQEVEKILPQSIISHSNFIPNVFKNVDSVDNVNSNIIISSSVLNINDNIKLIDNSNNEQIRKIININSNIITLDKSIDNYIDGDPLFVYGKEVEDLKTVNHNLIYNLNVKATQDLYNIIKLQQQEIEKLTNILISSNIISPF